MPIVNGKYQNPRWVNGQRPAIDAAELNAISDTLERLDEAPVLHYPIFDVTVVNNLGSSVILTVTCGCYDNEYSRYKIEEGTAFLSPATIQASPSWIYIESSRPWSLNLDNFISEPNGAAQITSAVNSNMKNGIAKGWVHAACTITIGN